MKLVINRKVRKGKRYARKALRTLRYSLRTLRLIFRIAIKIQLLYLNKITNLES
jgi:hypothetical protein